MMSRSYRKPYWTQDYGSKARKLAKRWSNRKVRRNLDINNGAAYKKLFNSWDICDWKIYQDREENEEFWKVERK